MSNYQELVTILKELLTNRFYPKPEYIRGLLGDGRGNVLVPGRVDYNYVRFSRASTETFEVFNKEVSQPVDGWPVLIGEFPWAKGLVQVVATDWSAYAQTGWGDSVASIQAHSPTQEWPNFAPGSDALNTYLRAITPMRTQAAGSGSSSVMVTAYEYDGPTGSSYGWPGTPILGLAGGTPPSGTMRYMGVYLNPATNTLGVVSGSTTIYTDALEPDRPTWPRGVLPSAYVRLYGGQAAITERDVRDARRLWQSSLIFTGSIAAASQATVNAGLDYSQAVTAGTLTNRKRETIKNTSGATANAGDVGYISDAGEYKTTTTASFIANWCVVVTGGANNSDVTIVTKGRHTVNYTGTAPSVSHFLTTSTVAGSALRSTVMDPAVFAVCLAAGSGGTVEVLLLTGRALVLRPDSHYLYGVTGASDSNFVSTIATLPGGAVLTYGAVSAGAANSIVPWAALDAAFNGKLVLHNTTRGTSALISAVVTGTSTITLTATVPAGWIVGDTVTTKSQTNTTGTIGGGVYLDLDYSGMTTKPPLGVAIGFQAGISDTGGGSSICAFHPFEANNNSKSFQVWGQVANVRNNLQFYVPSQQNKICLAWDGTGSGTLTVFLQHIGWIEATP